MNKHRNCLLSNGFNNSERLVDPSFQFYSSGSLEKKKSVGSLKTFSDEGHCNLWTGKGREVGQEMDYTTSPGVGDFLQIGFCWALTETALGWATE